MVYRRFFKRPIDFILSLIAIIILSPVYIITAILIRIKLGSPVLFKQKRPGLNGEIFWMYKFRTMTDKKNENGELLDDEFRMTRFGNMLRSTSLDELPELFNILKGDMSIVGPRPLLVEYLPLYNDEQARRHEVRPGLSGLAQIGGRNAISWEEKFKLDVEYVDNISFIGDIKIILITIKKVFVREGINSEDSVTMERFKGTKVESSHHLEGDKNLMKKELVIIGASGHGKVVSDIALNLNRWNKISFLDDNLSLKTSMNLDIIGTIEDAPKFIDKAEMFVAIGNNSIRKRIQEDLKSKGANLVSLIHPSSIIGSHVNIGLGTVIMPGAIVNCETTIGEGSIINTGSTIDHDNIIGNYVHISPGAHLAGTVRVGDRTWIGVGAIVSNNINICEDSTIGAGGVVVKDIDIKGTYVGVPVKIIKIKDKT
ncbi:NeuD/PglB/VioB family sugar acetyltransferase [Tissierella creatinophila]|uniref:Undecaprenyl phosphate N,N'-diacetylbacillosamine 1-phosphate transferase n=1 Tax=Tissierella creatinophila DSM 6911 TaxID=1123403 RepID=A0A1U7M5M7_TISCR|nr:NeuD/PglB/VioB family sugar acetyltransferase [Tissierella creatinophila]OLS02622.1 undecaprenyl phosphate N,N'-diacetylbacillosamine 1-phosphate transferase [Tissierella creatinophila DSM 6911]